MKKKIRLTSVLFVLLFLVGLGVMFYPQMSDLYARWQMGRELGKYQQVIEADHPAEDALLAEAEEYNRFLAQKEDQAVILLVLTAIAVLLHKRDKTQKRRLHKKY